MPYADDIVIRPDGNAAELVKTGSERERAAQAIGFAGKTDAVSSGLVFGSDDEGMRVAECGRTPSKPVGTKSPARAAASESEPSDGTSEVSGAGARADAAGQSAWNGAAPDEDGTLSALSNGNRSRSLTLGLGRAAVGALDESDELSGTSSVYDASSGAARLKRLLGTAHEAGRTEAASKSGSRDIARAKAERPPAPRETGARWRPLNQSHAAARAMTASKSIPAVTAGGSGAPAAGGAGAAAPSAVAGGAGGAGGAAAGAAAVPVAVAACLLLLLALIASAFTGLADPNDGVAQLNEVENQVYSFFREKGLDDIHIAAIMGNMKAESGMNPAKVESNGVGIGICQWSYGRADALREFAASEGEDWSDLGIQLEFFWEHDEYQNDWSATYRVSGGYSNPSPPPGTMVSGSKRGFLASDTVEEATRQFCYGWERAGFPRIDLRIEYALAYYSAFASKGGGEEYDAASARQKALVDACHRTGWPGIGLCATWVSRVFENAGYGYFGGNAEDQFAWWCHSSNRSELKVGMIIAVDDSPTSHWGHVGIYIGDNKVMESVSSGVVETDLDEWISYNGRNGAEPVRWGWCGGIDLS